MNVTYGILNNKKKAIWINQNKACFYEILHGQIPVRIIENSAYLWFKYNNEKHIDEWIADLNAMGWRFYKSDNFKKNGKVLLRINKNYSLLKICLGLSLLRLLREYNYDMVHYFDVNNKDLKRKYGRWRFLYYCLSFNNVDGGHTHVDFKYVPFTLTELKKRFKVKWIDKKMEKIVNNCGKPDFFTRGHTLREHVENMNDKVLRVFISGGEQINLDWLPHKPKIVTNIEDAGVVIFTGGSDVNPDLYGEKCHPTTHFSKRRDENDIKIYRQAQALNIKMIGLCRGNQFLCVQNGGKLVQDQNNQYEHKIRLYNGKEIIVNSTHHQAAYPFNMKSWDYSVLGWSENVITYKRDGNDNSLMNNFKRDCEIVKYGQRCLGIQYHPEYEDFQRNHPESIKETKRIISDFLIQ